MYIIQTAERLYREKAYGQISYEKLLQLSKEMNKEKYNYLLEAVGSTTEELLGDYLQKKEDKINELMKTFDEINNRTVQSKIIDEYGAANREDLIFELKENRDTQKFENIINKWKPYQKF